MKSRVWYGGEPPHIGWWNASVLEDCEIWRWWNGRCWSLIATKGDSAEVAFSYARRPDKHTLPLLIKWTTYYPKKARVPRIAS